MQKENGEKTKSGRKLRVLLPGLILILAIVSVTAFMNMQPESTKNIAETKPRQQIARIAEATFELEVADDNAEQVRGLSGRESLDENKAMLFVFEQLGQQCIWMKDMKFSLDILWLDENKKILKVAENISPDTYPESFCADNTSYVIEMNAGLAARHHIEVGQAVELKL